jgi:thymidylate kinase
MAAREIVVDGTDGAGKTTLVSELISTLSEIGMRVGTLAPYRVQEVYPLWQRDPVLAASTIVGIMDRFRSQQRGVDVIVWDRGWPTAFVSTTSAEARSLFQPFPDLTILLLNSDRATIAKVQAGSAAVWLTDPELRKQYRDAYDGLAAEVRDATLWVLQANASGYFDLQAIATRVKQWLQP